MTREDFNNFAKRSGLKVKFIAEQCGVPAYIMSHWTGCYGRLTHKQMERLENFCTDYEKNNAFMH